MTQTAIASLPTAALAGECAELPQPSDMELLRQFAGAGDPDAFAEIIRRYAGHVFGTCLRVLGDQARAEEVSQETFFRLLQRRHDINQSLGAWLHRTATHLSVDVLRSDTARRRREISYDANRDRQASTWAELSPAVDQALTELPDDLRQLLVQHYLLGHSQAQIAAESGQSPATVSRRIHHALNELRLHLRLKGICALPAVLAGLLCHASARQAPASLMTDLGKMSLYSSAAAAHAAYPGASASYASLGAIKTFLAIFLFLVGLLLVPIAVSHWWPASAPAADQDVHQRQEPASHLRVLGQKAAHPGQPAGPIG